MRQKRKIPPWFGRTRALLEKLESGSTVVETTFGPVEYALVGEGPVIIAQHGTPGGYDEILMFASDFVNEGFSLLAWSRPGYLLTPIESGRTVEAQADLMAALLDTLDIDKVAIFGASGGGPSTLQFALRHPNRVWAMILESAICREYRIPGSQKFFMNLLMNNTVSHFSNLYATYFTKTVIKGAIRAESTYTKEQLNRATDRIMSDPGLEAYRKAMLEAGSVPGARKVGFGNDSEQFAVVDSWPLEQIACPTLVIHGKLDADVPFRHAEYAASTIANAEAFFVEEGCHLLGLAENAAEITAAKIAFFEKHVPHTRS